MTSARWAAVGAAVAIVAALLVLIIQHATDRQYQRAFGLRIAATTAAYLSAVTPPPPRARGGAYDVGRLLTNSRALRTLPGWSSEVEVYHGTAPLVDATRPALSVAELTALEDGPRWQHGVALVPFRDRAAERVVGAVAVRPRRPARLHIPWTFPATLIAVAVGVATAVRRRPLARYAGAAALVAVAAFADVHGAARRSTDRWLLDTKLLLQEAAIRVPPPRARVALDDLGPVARGGELVPGDPAESVPRRLRIGEARRAVVAVLIGPNRWAELRTAPAEAGVPGGGAVWLLALATLAGPMGIVGVRWTERLAQRRELRPAAEAWGFLAPAAVYAVAFSLFPLALGLLGVLEDPRGAFGELTDPAAWASLGKTAMYTLYVPAALVVAVVLALLLHSAKRTPRLLPLLLIPFAVSPAAGALAWGSVFDAGTGVLWAFNPTTDPRTALPALMGIGAGGLIGAQVLLFLAALQGIPRQYIEAARLEGAGVWRVFWRVTVPLLRPLVLLALVTGVIAAFQGFTAVYVLTAGGPSGATDLVLHRVYRTGGEALALATGALLLGLTWVQVSLIRKRAHA